MSIEVHWSGYRFQVECDEHYTTEIREHSPVEVRVTVRRVGDNVTEVFAVNAKTCDNARIVSDQISSAILSAQRRAG